MTIASSLAVAEPAATPHEWCEERAQRLVRSAVKNKLGLFAAWPDISIEDLFSEALQAVRKNHHRYDPNLGNYSTFVYTVAGRRLLNLRRNRSRLARDEHAWAELQRSQPAYATLELPAEPEAYELIDEWLARLFALARRAYRPGATKRGRKWYSVPQCVAAAMLMRRLHLSSRAAELLLTDRPEIYPPARPPRLPAGDASRIPADASPSTRRSVPRSAQSLGRRAGADVHLGILHRGGRVQRAGGARPV